MKNLERLQCNICGSKNIKTIYINPDKLELKKCNNCSFLFSSPIPQSDSLEQFYSEEYFKHWFQYTNIKQKTNKYRLEQILKYKSNINSLFDYGCGLGLFLKTVKEQNINCEGIEYSKFAVDYALKNFGLQVHDSSKITDDFFSKNKEKFDAVTMWHTLEHLEKPNKILLNLHKILKKNGLLIIEIPNYLGLLSLIRGKSKIPLKEHLSHFTPDTVSKLIKKTGYSIIKNCPGNPGYTRTGWKVQIKKILSLTGKIIYFITGLNYADTILIYAVKNNINEKT